MSQKWYNIEVYLQKQIDRKSHTIYQVVAFSVSLNGP